MASNLRRSKRTIGRRLSYVEAKLNVSRRANVPRKLAPGTVTSPSLSPDVNATLTAVQISADGKNSIYRQADEPTGGVYVTGDLWFDTNNDNKFYRYDDAVSPPTGPWVGFTLGTNALANISANVITAGTIDASAVTVSNINAGNIVSGTLSSIELRAGTPTGGLYPFRVTTAGALRAVSGSIGGWSLSDTQILAGTVVADDSYGQYVVLDSGASILAYRKDYNFGIGEYWTKIDINDEDPGITVTGTASGTTLTSSVLSSQIQSRTIRHDDETLAGGIGRFSAYGSYVNFGEGDTLGKTMRIVLDNDLYGQGTGGAATLDVLVNANGTLVAPSSSIRFKENVNSLDIDYKKILAIEPVTFYYKDASEVPEGSERAIEYGVIAEQVEEAGVPELVNYKNGVPFSVPYSKLSVFLLEVCRKQEETIEDLKSRILALESQ